MQVATKNTQKFQDTRFAEDKVIFGDNTDQFDENVYEIWIPCDNDIIMNKYKSNDDKQVEMVIGSIDNTPYLISAITSSYAGEVQTSFSHQELTLNGLASFGKGLEPKEFLDIFNTILSKYDVNGEVLTYNDLLLLAEYSSEFNCSILHLQDEKKNVWLTVNKEGFFSKETIKLESREVKPKSAFSRG